MIPLTVHHRTAYRYRRRVNFWPHRLMLRPRESHDLQVISCVVTVSPTAQVTWAHDVFGNAVATAVLISEGASDNLVIESAAELRVERSAWPIFNVSASAIVYPFRYSDDDWTDLGSLTGRQYPDPGRRLANWARAFVCGDWTDTLSRARSQCLVPAWISYQSREDAGTQTPIETLDRGFGSCRDFAVLFVEAARTLGFGARLVSGYLFNPDQMLHGLTDAGSTHAWAEVFVLYGWISFDPTNRSVGGANLIPVAVARDIRQAAPVSGTYAGASDALEGMAVEVL